MKISHPSLHVILKELWEILKRLEKRDVNWKTGTEVKMEAWAVVSADSPGS